MGENCHRGKVLPQTVFAQNQADLPQADSGLKELLSVLVAHWTCLEIRQVFFRSRPFTFSR